MSVESYHHHQPQPKQLSPFNVDQPHPVQFIPQNGNDVKNIHRGGSEVRYVERDISDLNHSNVSPEVNHLSQYVDRMSVRETQQFPRMQFSSNLDSRNNAPSYGSSFQSHHGQNYLENAGGITSVMGASRHQGHPNAAAVTSLSPPKDVPSHMPQYPYTMNDGSHLLPGNTSSNSSRTNSINNAASCPPSSVYPVPVPAAASTPVGGSTQQFNRTNNNVHLPPPSQQSTYAQYNQKPYFASLPPHQFGGQYEQTNAYDSATTTNDRMGMIPSHGPSPVHRKLGPSPMTATTATTAAYPNNYQRQYSHLHQQSHLEHPSEMPNQKKLDPDQIPNPIQVMKEDEELHGGETFSTNQAGLVPPLVTTTFTVEDEGNCSPRFIRSSMYSIPCTLDMMKQADVPFSLVITPLATLPENEQSPPIVDTGEFGPVRCVRCKAYVNPYLKFIDGGRRFVCVLCSAVTEVPAEYFQHLDHTGARVDRYERPELIYGAYEFTVTKDYCKDNEVPNVPAFVFVIDVSYNNVKSGMVKLLCEQISDLIQNHMPRDDGASSVTAPGGSNRNSRMRVGFITYDSAVHFYNIKACLGQPQMMIVGDMEDMFVPLLDGFLCDPMESLTVIDTLMQQIPNSFCDTKETDTLLLPAIQAGLEALKAAKCAGKLLVFHSSLPTANVPGKLINREDRKLLGTEKEKILLTPQNTAYTNLARECVNAGCSVDLFVFNNSYVDLATIGQLSKLTGGEIFKYTYFQADIDGERFIEDLKRNLERQIAFDAVMRVRTSTGVRPVGFYGHMNMSTTTDIELASINADKSIAVEIKHDDKLNEEDGVFVQVALLYTSCSGQRRVRILNLALTCCSQMADLFRHCELDTLINYWAKAATFKLLEATPRQVKESLTSRCVRILACYRKLCANPSSPGQLILPECMKLLPLYTNCLLKSDAISGGSDMTADDRYFMMQATSIMDIPSSLNYFYPRLIPLVNIDLSFEHAPLAVRCTSCKLTNSEAYVLENGVYMFVWIGALVPKEWLVNVFGVADVSLINANAPKLPVFDNIHSKKINSMLRSIQKERRRVMKLTIVRENDKMEIVFKRFLVEDSSGGSFGGDSLSCSSYVDFLCHMHKEIRNLLS